MNKNVGDSVNVQIEDWYKTYRGLVYYDIQKRMECSREEAEDLTEEVFLRAYRSLKGRADPIDFPKSYLMKAAENVCNSQLHTNTDAYEVIYIRHAPLLDGEERSLLDDPEDDVENQPEHVAEKHELMEAIREQLAELPPEQHRAVLFHYVYELTFDEISDMYAQKASKRASSTVGKDARKGIEQLRVRLTHMKP